jgi:hypothetical protein
MTKAIADSKAEVIWFTTLMVSDMFGREGGTRKKEVS